MRPFPASGVFLKIKDSAVLQKFLKLDFIRDIKIWHKMIILLQILFIPMILIFLVFLLMMNKMHDMGNRILSENVSNIRAAYKVELSLLNLKGINANYILDSDKRWLARFETNVKDFNYWYNRAFIAARTEEEHHILTGISLNFEKYCRYHEMIVKLVDRDRELEALRLHVSDSSNNFYAAYQGCEDLIKKNEELISNSEREAEIYLSRTMKFGYLTIACFIILGIMSAMLITKSILDPIMEMEKGSDSVAPLKSDKVEIEKLKERFQNMVKTIKDSQQKMISSERKAAIGEISAGLSHELNNPLGIICGFSERLLQSESLPKKNREAVQTIHHEALRCRDMLGQLLNFARQPEPNYNLTGIKSLLRQMAKIFENQDKYKNVNFSIDVPRDPVKVYMDSVQMRQVLLNIVLNACDAINNRGKVSIKLETERKNAVIRIRDNGSGIRPEIKDKIFTPFFSTKPKGVGLGLAVCRDIIEKHSGSINAESEPGKFTEFIIRLPRGRHG
jgi:signal transduction histidine kinase